MCLPQGRLYHGPEAPRRVMWIASAVGKHIANMWPCVNIRKVYIHILEIVGSAVLLIQNLIPGSSRIDDRCTHVIGEALEFEGLPFSILKYIAGTSNKHYLNTSQSATKNVPMNAHWHIQIVTSWYKIAIWFLSQHWPNNLNVLVIVHGHMYVYNCIWPQIASCWNLNGERN